MNYKREAYIEELVEELHRMFHISIPIVDIKQIVEQLGGNVQIEQNSHTD